MLSVVAGVCRIGDETGTDIREVVATEVDFHAAAAAARAAVPPGWRVVWLRTEHAGYQAKRPDLSKP